MASRIDTIEITEERMTFDDSKELLGEWPKDSQIDFWHDPVVDTRYVFRTALGETVIAGIKKKVYQDEKYDEIKDCLMSIDSTSTMRASAAGPIDIEERGWTIVDHDEKTGSPIYGDDDGNRYKLRTKNSYFKVDSKGKMSGVAQGNEIHSVMIGHKRGRLTGRMAPSNWMKDNPAKSEILCQIPAINDIAYEELAPNEYNFQKSYAEKAILPEHRLGGSIHTTLSANKYSTNGSRRMSYHIDSGDLDGGLTTIATFLEGDVKTYFVLPRFGLAVARGDGDVFIGDSGQVHGVIDIEGDGISMNCVSYCDTRLATQSNMGKPEKLIGQLGKKQAINLEELFG